MVKKVEKFKKKLKDPEKKERSKVTAFISKERSRLDLLSVNMLIV